MTTSATATISNDVNFTLIKTGSNNQNESASLNYSRNLTNGTGSLNVNYGVVASGTMAAGGKLYFDLRALEKAVFNTTATIQFSKLKSIVVYNMAQSYLEDLEIHATGSNAFTEMFNGGSGAIIIKPYAVHQYSDPISGAVVDATNKDFTLYDVAGSGVDWRMVVVGVTG